MAIVVEHFLSASAIYFVVQIRVDFYTALFCACINLSRSRLVVFSHKFKKTHD
jgi:hypothetical protein